MNHNSTLEQLLVEWRVAKQLEQEAICRRRKIEDQIKSTIGFDENREKSVTLPFYDGRVTITGRLDRKVDAQLARQLAKEKCLEDWLDQLFRWKAEVNLRIWHSAPATVLQAFTPAVTTKPGRATFAFEGKETKDEVA